MKRLLTTALAAALVAAGTGSEAQAQEVMDRRVPAFDLGLYAGGAYTTSWFEINDEGFEPGLSSIFGLTATYWASPLFGIRYHTGYFPTELPDAGDEVAGDLDSGLIVNNWLFDLNLAFRPWITQRGGWMGSAYFFLGGGALVTNIAGNPTPAFGEFPCVQRFTSAGICLSQDPEYATVGQANAGFGFDLIPLTPSVGVFLEGAVHGYDSPAHNVVGENNTVGEDKFAFTPRLVAGVKFAFGDLTPPPPPPPPVAPPPPPPPVVEPVEERIRVCVIEGTALREVEAIFLPERGDTVVVVQGERRPFAQVYPAVSPPYAAGEPWFINNEPIMVMDRRYVKYGLPRVIGTDEVTRVAEYRGIGVFAEVGAPTPPEVIYIPVRTGCEFQPYRYEVPARGVRG